MSDSNEKKSAIMVGDDDAVRIISDNRYLSIPRDVIEKHDNVKSAIEADFIDAEAVSDAVSELDDFVLE